MEFEAENHDEVSGVCGDVGVGAVVARRAEEAAVVGMRHSRISRKSKRGSSKRVVVGPAAGDVIVASDVLLSGLPGASWHCSSCYE